MLLAREEVSGVTRIILPFSSCPHVTKALRLVWILRFKTCSCISCVRGAETWMFLNETDLSTEQQRCFVSVGELDRLSLSNLAIEEVSEGNLEDKKSEKCQGSFAHTLPNSWIWCSESWWSVQQMIFESSLPSLKLRFSELFFPGGARWVLNYMLDKLRQGYWIFGTKRY